MRRRYRPMLAGTAEAPFSSDDWGFEVKWDGVRAIAYVDGDLEIFTRNDRDLSYGLRELAELRTLAPGTVLDGELVAMAGGKPDIQRLMERLSTTGERMEDMAAENPVTYVVFDILEEEGKPLISLPLVERRRHLEERVKEGLHVVRSELVEGRGEEYYRAVVKAGLEGVMAKRKDSPYEPGQRTRTWLKVKHLRTCDCVIFGYTAGNGARAGSFGALILGLFSPDGTAEYVGKVGTGFSDAYLAELKTQMDAYRTDRPLLQAAEIRPEEVTWLRPVLVGEILYQTLTRERRLRMPRFIRLRPDKEASECTTDQLESGTPVGPVEKKPGEQGPGSRNIAETGESTGISGRQAGGEPDSTARAKAPRISGSQAEGEPDSTARAKAPGGSGGGIEGSPVPVEKPEPEDIQRKVTGKQDQGPENRLPSGTGETANKKTRTKAGDTSKKQKRGSPIDPGSKAILVSDSAPDKSPEPDNRKTQGKSLRHPSHSHKTETGENGIHQEVPLHPPVKSGAKGQTTLVPVKESGGEVQGRVQPKAESKEEALMEYREKRDFSKTTEPTGESPNEGESKRFVVHEHHASHLHYDFRIEYEGVLKSWAVPRGVPGTPGERRLAIRTEDHPLEYAKFEGTIPAGEYGAGTVTIWDEGTYELIKWRSDKVELIIHGKRMSGFYVLLSFRKAGPGEWLMIKGND